MTNKIYNESVLSLFETERAAMKTLVWFIFSLERKKPEDKRQLENICMDFSIGILQAYCVATSFPGLLTFLISGRRQRYLSVPFKTLLLKTGVRQRA